MQNNSTPSLTLQQLHRAVALKQQIEDLEAALGQIFGGRAAVASPAAGVTGFKRSAATRAKMAAAQRARYSNVKQEPTPAARKVGRKFSAEARARMVAGARARWAKLKGTSRPKVSA